MWFEERYYSVFQQLLIKFEVWLSRNLANLKEAIHFDL